MSPLYTYECPRGHRFDKRVPMAEMDRFQPCEGRMAKPGLRSHEIPKVVQCKVPAKRLEVPSSPASFVIR